MIVGQDRFESRHVVSRRSPSIEQENCWRILCRRQTHGSNGGPMVADRRTAISRVGASGCNQQQQNSTEGTHKPQHTAIGLGHILRAAQIGSQTHFRSFLESSGCCTSATTLQSTAHREWLLCGRNCQGLRESTRCCPSFLARAAVHNRETRHSFVPSRGPIDNPRFGVHPCAPQCTNQWPEHY